MSGNENSGSNGGQTNNQQKAKRGFARNPELARAAGRKGGLSVAPEKRSFSTNPELARAAGRKGGLSVAPSERSFSKNPELARSAGRKGGQSVAPENRSFSQNPELAREAGRKGGSSRGASAQTAVDPTDDDTVETEVPDFYKEEGTPQDG